MNCLLDREAYAGLRQLASLLGGLIVIRVELEYWDDAPMQRKREFEYFLYKKTPEYYAGSDYYEKLEDPSDSIRTHLARLLQRRHTAQVSFSKYMSGPAFLEKILGNDSGADYGRPIVLSGPRPRNGKADLSWGYRDTLILVDSGLVDYLEYLRSFPEYRQYERHLKQRDSTQTN